MDSIKATARPSACIYSRISDDREGMERGIDRQREDCAALAERLGFEVVAVFVDNDISASTKSRKHRPQYSQMMTRARRGEFAAILAYSNSRLTRRPREFEDLIDLCDRHRVRIVTVVSGEDDLSTADGRMTARIKASVDSAEAERTSERAKRAKMQAAAEGLFRGGARPYGYEAGGLVINEPEAEVIRSTSAALLAGRPLMALARELRDAGLKTSTGARWDHTKLRSVLMRPRNAGLISTGRSDRHDPTFRIVGPAQWPGIVDEETWRAVHTLLADPTRRTHGLPRNDVRWLGSGIYTCGRCANGATLRAGVYGGTESRPHPKRFLYRCTERAHLTISTDKTDAYVREVVAELVRDPRIAAALTPDTASETNADRERRTMLTQRIEQTEADYDDDLIDARRYRSKIDKLNEELAEVDARLSAALTGLSMSPVFSAPDPGQAFLDAPVDVQRAVLASVLRVEVMPTPGRGSAWTADRLRLTPVVDLDEDGAEQ